MLPYRPWSRRWNSTAIQRLVLVVVAARTVTKKPYNITIYWSSKIKLIQHANSVSSGLVWCFSDVYLLCSFKQWVTHLVFCLLLNIDAGHYTYACALSLSLMGYHHILTGFMYSYSKLIACAAEQRWRNILLTTIERAFHQNDSSRGVCGSFSYR